MMAIKYLKRGESLTSEIELDCGPRCLILNMFVTSAVRSVYPSVLSWYKNLYRTAA